MYMQKVKVQRYVTGKRPDYAPSSDEEYASDDEFVAQQQPAGEAEEVELTAQEREDPRLRRLLRLQQQREDRGEEEEDEEEREEEAANSDASESAPRRRWVAHVGRGCPW